MAFKSIGQKYGFVSAGDVFRQQIAAERQKAEAERQKAEAERQKAENAEAEIVQNRTDTQKVLREMGMSEEQIAEIEARLDALRQSRLSKEQVLTK
jgi:hypothetical protein